MRKFSPRIVTLINESGLNLNHISKSTGISNVYLRKLVHGTINRPGKDKIASIMLALNQSVSSVNAMLKAYDYQPLAVEDIPAILENNRRRKIVGGNLPQHDHIYFDLLLAVLERTGGARILVKNRPSGVFMPAELYLMKEYPYESDTAAARFRYELTKALIMERRELFIANLEAGCRLETYICKSCFDDYLARHIGPTPRREHPRRAELVVQYLANALSLAIKRPQLHQIRIMERCPYFHFLIQDADGDHPKVSYPGRKLHVFDNEYDMRMLEGFTTDLPLIVGQFKNEVEMCQRAADVALIENYPDTMLAYMTERVDRYGMAALLKRRVSALLKRPALSFF
ncbi:MAG: hypothetical protein QNJ22_02655 [Desulfosarcinaceae bacterium]|nr:hypothetical protein [Desulfosarcinaceae bacterium]